MLKNVSGNFDTDNLLVEQGLIFWERVLNQTENNCTLLLPLII